MDKELYEEPVKSENKTTNNIQEVKVVEKKPIIEQVNNNVFQFKEQLELLKSMGFENESLNTYLLNKFQGNIQKVVGELLTNPTVQK